MKQHFKNHFHGILITAVVAAIAITVQGSALFTKVIPLNPLIIAIVIGFAINNVMTLPVRYRAGIKFSAKRILRLAIVLLGFRLSFSEIRGVGIDALITIGIASILTLLFTVWLGTRMGIPLKRSILLGSGVSICGASAVAAVDGVIQSREEDAAFAIGAITLIGTVFMFVYPVIYRIAGLQNGFYALWAGSSIHEVAQVTAAGSVMNDAVTEALASSVKMIRVLFIIPLTFVLLFLPAKKEEATHGQATSAQQGKIAIPWFAILFFISVIVNSSGIISHTVNKAIVLSDGWLMAIAMAGLGLDISLRSFARIGKKALILGVVSSFTISLLSGVVIAVLHSF